MSARSRTVYLRPPEPKRARRGEYGGVAHGVQSWLFRYRFQLMPLGGIGLFLLGTAALVAQVPAWAPWVFLVLAGVVPGATYRWGHRLRFQRYRPLRLARDRYYLMAVAGTAFLWSAGNTWGGHAPGLRPDAMALLAGCLAAVPWWWKHRNRGSIPVRLDDLDGQQVQEAVDKARYIVADWAGFSSAGHIQGARLRALTFDPWSLAMAVELRRGATLGEFTQRRLEKLESAYRDCRPGSVRVEPVEDRNAAGLAVVRFMLDDPHAAPVAPPELGITDVEDVVLGLFETGQRVVFKLINTVIAGCTGAGKSGVINALIRALARMRCVAIVGVDLKPGAPELSPWRDVMHALATNPAECAEVFGRLILGLTWRGEEMTRRGWKNWRPTPSHPFIVIIVDEAAEVRNAGLGRQMDRIASMIRAFGGCLVVATQYPDSTSGNLSQTVKQNSPQRVGLKTEDPVADRVIFGEQATRGQWKPSTLPADRPGSFFIRSPLYSRALRARAFYISEDSIPGEITVTREHRTMIDQDTWPLAEGEHFAPAGAIGGGHDEAEQAAGPQVIGDEAVDGDEVVDAELVETDEDKILEYLGRVQSVSGDGLTAGEIGEALGFSRPTVYRKIKGLVESGQLGKQGRSKYVRI